MDLSTAVYAQKILTAIEDNTLELKALKTLLVSVMPNGVAIQVTETKV